jgi:hypothetical protein
MLGLDCVTEVNGMPQSLIFALRQAALSPYAFIGYIAVVGAWAYVVSARNQLRLFADDLKQLPKADRWKAVQQRYNVFPREGLAAEDYLRSRRQSLLFLAFLSIVVAVVVVVTVAMTQETSRREIGAERSTDWQTFLYTKEIQVLKGEKPIGSILCGTGVDATTGRLVEPTPNQRLTLPTDTDVLLLVAVKLVVDNIFRKNEGLVYPIGFSTTWDHRVFTIYDGQDAQQWRTAYGSKMDRDFERDIALHTPNSPGTQYLLIMTGAALDARQLFAASSSTEESVNAIWNLPFNRFEGKECGGYLEHTFMHPGQQREHVNFPLIAVPVDIVVPAKSTGESPKGRTPG